MGGGTSSGTASASRPFPIVVTRVAVRRHVDPEPPSVAWVRDRVALLRQVSWPALQRAGTPLAWVLVADPERRELVRELTDDLSIPDGSVHVAAGVGFTPSTADLTLDEPVRPGAERFVTVRLDSDDALLPGALRDVVELATTADDGALIDLAHGFQVELGTGTVVETWYPPWRQGPFLAVVHRGRASMFDTGGQHTEARDGRSAVLRLDGPAWLQAVHGANVANALDSVPAPVRLARAARRLGRRGVDRAWRDGRPLGPGPAAEVLARAGVVP